MAEIEGTNAGAPAAPAAPAPEAPKKSEGQSQPTEGEEKWFVPNKFKTPEDMATSYGELEKKLGEVGDKYGQLETYVASVNGLLNVIQGDPNLQQQIREKQGVPTPATPEEPATAQPNQDLDEIKQTMRLGIIGDFDRKFGIKDEEMQDVHKKVGQELAALGHNIKTAPLDLLPSLLDKAFKLSHSDRAADAAKQAGVAQTVTNMQAQVPTQGGGSLSSDGGNQKLDQEQLDWVKKLGFTESDAQKNNKTEATK